MTLQVVLVSAVVFGVLGPLEVTVDGRAAAVGGPKPRAILATLLLHVNTAVSVDLLAEVLWPSGPPRSAVANIRTYVHGLRRRLAGSAADIEHRSSGYVLVTDPDLVDVHRFEAEVSRAGAVDDRAEALALLDRACSRWRGEPLADLPHSHMWTVAVARLTELRLSAEEHRLRLRIDLGEPGDAVTELRALLGEHPLREDLWQLLIRALIATGRSAEARRTYAEAEQVLRSELHAVPGPELRRLGEQLRAPADPSPVCQLPLDLPDFTGREHLVDELVELLRRRRARGVPAVVVISGPPGVGKSAVSVRVAHAVRAEFPDGQLHVDLAGTSARPRTATEVLAELLRALGAQDSAMPRQPNERAALLRSRLANTRTCVVLDDAASAAQVRALLPGAGGCAVLVTSRAMLPDLSGAQPVELDVLGADEGARLLAGIVGEQRVAAEPDSAADILRFCGFLPLAIRVAGTRLRHRPGWTLRTMAGRLRDEHGRLDELRVGDLAVRASVNLSYDLLTPDAARALRWLGMVGPGHWPGWVVAALLGRPSADDVLDLLVDSHLVELVGSDLTGAPRYQLHDLLRCYAADLAEQDPTADRRAAVRRVLEGYLSLAVSAAESMPIRFLGVFDAADGRATWRPHRAAEVVADPLAWFEAERRAGAAAVSLAQDWGLDDLAWRVTAAYTPYFDMRGHHDDWHRTHRVALAAARRAGDSHGQAIVLRNLGQLALYQDAYDDAWTAFDESVRLFGQVGDRRGAGFALAGLGTVLRIRGDYAHALDRCHEALSMFAAVPDPHGEAVARLAAGSVWLELGCLSPAQRWFADAHELSVAIGDRHREAHALRRIATLHRRRGDLRAAREHTDRAVAIFRELDDDNCVGYANHDLGLLCLEGGDLSRARPLLDSSLHRHRRCGDRRSEAEVVEALGRLHEALGEPGQAERHFRRARDLWGGLDMVDQAAGRVGVG
ncbi:MAG: BTAD domain-containing putative transcriptional regulator [Actinophytocola sp.]|uniref:AfsR/SARP family transcriptional regulator n=1 Tax=Actinophytocola sp. TaxID=1872138 RepID=UPI003D6A61B4